MTINGADVSGNNVNECVAILQNSPRPVMVVFQDGASVPPNAGAAKYVMAPNGSCQVQGPTANIPNNHINNVTLPTSSPGVAPFAYTPVNPISSVNMPSNSPGMIEVEQVERYPGCCTWVWVILCFPFGFFAFWCPCDKKKVNKKVPLVAHPPAPQKQIRYIGKWTLGLTIFLVAATGWFYGLGVFGLLLLCFPFDKKSIPLDHHSCPATTCSFCCVRDEDDKTPDKADCATCCRSYCCSKRCHKRCAPCSYFIGGAMAIILVIVAISQAPAMVNIFLFFLIFVFVAPTACKRYNSCSHEELTEREEANKYLDRFGWLFLKYNPESFHWEIVVVVRKLFMLLISKFLTNVPVWSMPLLSIVIIGSIYVQVRNRPYVDDCPAERVGKWDFDANNRLETMFLMAQLVLVLGQFANGWMASGDDNLYTQDELDKKYPAVGILAVIFEWVGVLMLFSGTMYFFAVHSFHFKMKLLAKKKENRKKDLQRMRRKSTMNPLNGSGLETFEKQQQERAKSMANNGAGKTDIELTNLNIPSFSEGSDTVSNPLFQKSGII